MQTTTYKTNPTRSRSSITPRFEVTYITAPAPRHAALRARAKRTHRLEHASAAAYASLSRSSSRTLYRSSSFVMRNEQATAVHPVVPPTAPALPVVTAPPQPSLDRRYVTAALCLVMVLASMEMTVVSTAMPTIIGELHGLEHYSWVSSIYLLACTVSMPLYGRLADALGRKRVLLAAISLFCGASLLASTAHTMVQLVIFRGLQGLGAGGIMPVVLTIQGDVFTLEERAKIQGFFSAVWGCAALAGPA